MTILLLRVHRLEGNEVGECFLVLIFSRISLSIRIDCLTL